MPKKKTRVNTVTLNKPEKKKRDVNIEVKVETPWSEKTYSFEMKNVTPGLRHKDSRWGICILRGLQTEFGNTVKPK